MKRLLFKMSSDSKELINKELPYYINENRLNFSDEQELYKIILNEHVFMKKNQESLIKIDFKKKLMHIDVLDSDLHLDIELKKSRFIITNNLIAFNYILDDGEDVLIKVEIHY